MSADCRRRVAQQHRPEEGKRPDEQRRANPEENRGLRDVFHRGRDNDEQHRKSRRGHCDNSWPPRCLRNPRDRGRFFERAGEHRAGSQPFQLPDTKPDGNHHHQQRPDSAADQAGRGDMQLEERSSHRVAPPGAESVHHQSGVANCSRQAQKTSDRRDDGGFFEQQPADHRDRLPARQQYSDFLRAALHPQPKQQGNEHRGRGDQEHAEADEQLRKISRAARSFKRSRLDRLKREPVIGRIHVPLQFLPEFDRCLLPAIGTLRGRLAPPSIVRIGWSRVSWLLGETRTLWARSGSGPSSPRRYRGSCSGQRGKAGPSHPSGRRRSFLRSSEPDADRRPGPVSLTTPFSVNV